MTEDQAPPLPVVRRRTPALPAVVEVPIDAAVGAAVTVARPVVGVTIALTESFAPVVRSVWGVVARPPLVPEQLTIGHALDRFVARGRAVRYAAGEDLTVISDDTLDLLVPEILTRVLDRIDLTGLVMSRVDLGALANAVIDEMDLTQVVLEKVDLGVVIREAVGQVDLNTLIRESVDVAGLAEEVIDEIDLPDIIRDSTSDVASVFVDGARLSAVSGDELVNRWVDRIMLRRRARRTDAPGEPMSARRDDEGER